MQAQYLMKDPYETYREQGVLTAGPMELILMLYNGIHKNLVLAKRDMEHKDTESAHNRLIKTQNIVHELLNSLDMSFSISHDLMAIYDYMLYSLANINATKNADDVDPLLGIADTLREAWQEANKLQKSGLEPVGLYAAEE